jgi:hypothetical protein
VLLQQTARFILKGLSQ